MFDWELQEASQVPARIVNPAEVRNMGTGLNVAPPLPHRAPGYSNGELKKQAGRHHASIFSSSSKVAVAGAQRCARMVTGLPSNEASDPEVAVSELAT